MFIAFITAFIPDITVFITPLNTPPIVSNKPVNTLFIPSQALDQFSLNVPVIKSTISLRVPVKSDQISPKKSDTGFHTLPNHFPISVTNPVNHSDNFDQTLPTQVPTLVTKLVNHVDIELNTLPNQVPTSVTSPVNQSDIFVQILPIQVPIPVNSPVNHPDI